MRICPGQVDTRMIHSLARLWEAGRSPKYSRSLTYQLHLHWPVGRCQGNRPSRALSVLRARQQHHGCARGVGRRTYFRPGVQLLLDPLWHLAMVFGADETERTSSLMRAGVTLMLGEHSKLFQRSPGRPERSIGPTKLSRNYRFTLSPI
jgi:hypothetical protein